MPSPRDCRMFEEEEKGMKFDFSKPQWSLLPLKDLEGAVRVMEHGAKKYARDDYKFVKEGHYRYFDAALRHLADHREGNYIDEESGLLAIDHAIASLIIARHHFTKEKGKEICIPV